jgi:hypothetical protein
MQLYVNSPPDWLFSRDWRTTRELLPSSSNNSPSCSKSSRTSDNTVSSSFYLSAFICPTVSPPRPWKMGLPNVLRFLMFCVAVSFIDMQDKFWRHSESWFPGASNATNFSSLSLFWAAQSLFKDPKTIKEEHFGARNRQTARIVFSDFKKLIL